MHTLTDTNYLNNADGIVPRVYPGAYSHLPFSLAFGPGRRESLERDQCSMLIRQRPSNSLRTFSPMVVVSSPSSFSVYWAFDHHWGAQVDRCLLLIGATPLQMCGRSNSGIRLHRHLRETPDEERDHHDCRTPRQSRRSNRGPAYQANQRLRQLSRRHLGVQRPGLGRVLVHGAQPVMPGEAHPRNRR